MKDKLEPARVIFYDSEWKLNKWQQFKINVKVDIICMWYKIKYWLTDKIK